MGPNAPAPGPVSRVVGQPAAAMRRPAAAIRRPAASSEGLQTHVPAERTEQDGPTNRTKAPPARDEGKRQYTWWMTLGYPYPATVARLNLRTPDDFDHQSFFEFVLDVHQAANIAPVGRSCVFQPSLEGAAVSA